MFWVFLVNCVIGVLLFYLCLFGLSMMLIFIFCIGYVVIVVELVLNVMGFIVENFLDGVFKKCLLIWVVVFGVGIGVVIGVVKILFGFLLGYILIVIYLLVFVLIWFLWEELVNFVWDSVGVIIGLVIVLLLFVLGVGLVGVVGVVEGFGILVMCLVGLIFSVFLVGLWIDWKICKNVYRRV